jgi:protein SCO1/2
LPRANEARICQGPAVSGRRTLLVMVAIVVAAAIPAVAIPMYFLRSPPPELPDYGALPRFHLIDERGQPFTDDALRGNATIVSFIFTRCDVACPITSMKMANLQERVLLDEGVKLLSISVDPTYDTPPRLAAYAERYHANDTKWRFVTGDKDKIYSLIEGGFMTHVGPDGTQLNGAPGIAHRPEFFLVDRDLHLRGWYAHDDEVRLDALVRDARYLARAGRSK